MDKEEFEAHLRMMDVLVVPINKNQHRYEFWVTTINDGTVGIPFHDLSLHEGQPGQYEPMVELIRRTKNGENV